MKTIRGTDPAALQSLAIGLAESGGTAIPAKLIGVFSQLCNGQCRQMAEAISRDLTLEPVPSELATQASNLLDHTLPLPKAMANLYQRLLAAGFDSSRKSMGSYYTPDWVVDFIVQEALDPIILSLSKDARELPHQSPTLRQAQCDGECHDVLPRVLDPACGAGFFLTSALHRLTEAGVPAESTLRHCMSGRDLDPVAVFLARLSLGLHAGDDRSLLESISRNIRVGDALAESAVNACDAIVGNPPYLFGENVSREVRDRRREFGLARGQFDVYWLFFEAALNGMLADGGVYGMIVPDAVLARDDASGLRSELTKKHRLLSIAHLGQVFPGTGVSAAVVVWQKGGAPIGQVRVYSAVGATLTETESVDQQQLSSEPKCRWLVHVGSKGRRALKQIESVSVPLGELVTIRRGEELGTAALTNSGKSAPILAGRDIQALGASTPVSRVDPGKLRKPSAIYAGPKLVFVKTGQGIVATVDYSDTPALQSVYVLHTNAGLGESVSLEYLAAVLTSSLLDWVARRTFTDYKRLFPQFNQTTVKSLPIRTIEFTTPEDVRGRLTGQGIELCEGAGGCGGFVRDLLSSVPERADVVHDILTHLAKQAILLDQSENKELRLRVLKQLDEIVWLLYGLAPSDLQ